MKKYSKYKKVNLDFIGQLPDDWELLKLKFVGDSTIGITYSPKDVSDSSEGTLVLRASNIQNSQLSLKDNVYVNKEYTDKYKIKAGDILICSRSGSKSLIGKNIQIKDKEVEGSYFGAFMTVFRSPENKYIQKVLSSNLFDYQIELFSTTTINQLTIGTLNTIYVPFPREKNEREGIATYLDHKTALIDKLIASNEKQIKLLEEKRKATINQAVSKGLDLNVKMKDSGVEWIGEIPEGWEVKKLKYSVQLLSEKGNVFKKIALENIQSKTGKYIETDTIFQGDGVIFNKGDILFGKLRPYLAKVWEAEFQGSAVGDFFVMRPNQSNNPTYRKYQILSDLIIDVLNGSTYGAKMPRVSWDFMGELLLPEPPIDQQEEIANYLDGVNQETQDLITKVRKQNKLLKEYRQSLISHVVTGKVDVRDEVKILIKEDGI